MPDGTYQPTAEFSDCVRTTDTTVDTTHVELHNTLTGEITPFTLPDQVVEFLTTITERLTEMSESRGTEFGYVGEALEIRVMQKPTTQDEPVKLVDPAKLRPVRVERWEDGRVISSREIPREDGSEQ